jgi:signal transduction histidine kinase
MTPGLRARLTRLPLRVRLVAGFAVAMLVLLAAAGAFVYWRVEYALDRGLDTELDQAAGTLTPLVTPSGTVSSRDTADATGAVWQVLDDSGRVLDHGASAPERALVSPDVVTAVRSGTLTRDLGPLLPAAAKPYRVHITAVEPGRVYLLIGVRRDHRDEALRELLAQLTIAGLGALLVAAVVGDRLARAALRPVERYRRRAEEIAGGAQGLRLEVPLGRDDEVTRLGTTLNDMLTTLDQALDRERRFINDASHELRTPLTLLTSRIQLARRRARSKEEHEAVLQELEADVARLVDLAEQLLTLGATGVVQQSDADLSVVAAVVRRRQLSRPDEADQVTLELPAGAGRAEIDPLALERVVANLVENAFRHGAPPVRVRVSCAQPRGGPPWVLIQVQDAGPGMPADLLADATDRFTRSPEARSRPGAGLGLALVRDVIVDAEGELRLCHQGVHRSHGHRVEVPCDHGPAMTVSVYVRSTRS